MNHHVSAIAGRLSLRKPQRDSLEILDRITEIVPPHKSVDLNAALEIIRSEFPTVLLSTRAPLARAGRLNPQSSILNPKFPMSFNPLPARL